ncbi:MAG: ABC transporter substrate-binding protein [Deltaproteobacteria bacterium]|nr:ABC transporter substrate-binding protein [Deltaproteobacteria bacterium]MBW2072567.1 ABC transporter substrate-binding protein [Deltaproteobacteria bacterium]
MKRMLIVIIASLFVAVPVYGQTPGPGETVKADVTKVLDILRDPALKGETAKEIKKKKLEQAADHMFDYTALSKLTLSRNWKKLNAAQQKEFVELFRQVLEQAYMDKILSYSNEKVVFDKARMLTARKAEVPTRVVTKSNEIPITYRVYLKDGTWKIYDVVVEGVSLVQNYRTQFKQILSNNPPEELLKQLREKVAKSA